MQVQCNHCMHQCDEAELVKDESAEGYCERCPVCNADDALMDLD